MPSIPLSSYHSKIPQKNKNHNNIPMHINLELPSKGSSNSSNSTSSKEISNKLRSSRYKGVVPQQNGRWGAQIYEHHRRIWLGTFSDEATAARIYDIAAQRFRGADASTNFSRLRRSDPDAAAELQFLSSRTKSDIIRMLRSHTYHEELKNSRRRKKQQLANPNPNPSKKQTKIQFLFNKTVTPSDVGKLNRLVIPKQHAERHFPVIGKDEKRAMNFEDGEGKVWRFTYSYWNSSQSYVMTKGWRLFVKEKGVREGDAVGFWRAVDGEGFKQCLIDVLPRSTHEDQISADQSRHDDNRVMIRLFGVDICKSDQAGKLISGSDDCRSMRCFEMIGN